jgi:hypothetical protein
MMGAFPNQPLGGIPPAHHACNTAQQMAGCHTALTHFTVLRKLWLQGELRYSLVSILDSCLTMAMAMATPPLLAPMT